MIAILFDANLAILNTSCAITHPASGSAHKAFVTHESGWGHWPQPLRRPTRSVLREEQLRHRVQRGLPADRGARPGGAAVSDNAVVTVESGCTWRLTGDCTLTSLTNHGTIDFNGHTITLADGTVLS